MQVGRQAVAGLNPFTIKIATLDLFNGTSKITAEDLSGVSPLSGVPAVLVVQRGQ